MTAPWPQKAISSWRTCRGSWTSKASAASSGRAAARRFTCWTRSAVISPTHKRTEGRAPVWGSEFTSKDAAIQGGDPAETAASLNVKLWVLVTDCLVVRGDWPNPTSFSTRKLKADTEIKSRRGAGHSRGIRGCWFVLLFRTLPPAAPPASSVAPVSGMIGRVLYTAAATRPAGPHTDIQCRNRRR